VMVPLISPATIEIQTGDAPFYDIFRVAARDGKPVELFGAMWQITRLEMESGREIASGCFERIEKYKVFLQALVNIRCMEDK